MRTSAKSFLTPAQVERAVKGWLAAGFGPGNTHVVRQLSALLRDAELSADGVAVLALCREDVLAVSPGLSERQISDLLNRDWEPEMGGAREEMLRVVRETMWREGMT